MSLERIIVLTGKQRSGKDTIANYLVGKYGYKHYSMSEEVRRYCYETYGRSYSDRETLIKIAEGVRSINNTVWIRRVHEQLWQNARLGHHSTAVISGVRHPEDLLYLQQQSQYQPTNHLHVVYVGSNEYLRKQREGYSPEHVDHYTEHLLDFYATEHIIYNNYNDKVMLYAEVDLLLEEILKKERGEG